jgi:hypothetical protein
LLSLKLGNRWTLDFRGGRKQLCFLLIFHPTLPTIASRTDNSVVKKLSSTSRHGMRGSELHFHFHIEGESVHTLHAFPFLFDVQQLSFPQSTHIACSFNISISVLRRTWGIRIRLRHHCFLN